jgi:hypothetical protein
MAERGGHYETEHTYCNEPKMSKPWKLAYHKRRTTTGKGKHSSRKRGKKKKQKK